MFKSKSHHTDADFIRIKTKFHEDIIRFSMKRNEPASYEEFRNCLAEKHDIRSNSNFLIWYTDPMNGDLLPINNENNFARAQMTAKSLLRIFIHSTARSVEEVNGCNTMKSRNLISSILHGTPGKLKNLQISQPHNFRQVSAIIDVDILPETCRRVRLMKHGSDKPLGFYIKEGESFRVLPISAGGGLEKIPAVFISRVIPGGLAESSGLLAVNDEVLEVNGIEVAGKTLDQVTDMMIANASNLIITVKPANQRSALRSRQTRSLLCNSPVSSYSQQSMQSASTSSDDEADDVVDLTSVTHRNSTSKDSHTSHLCQMENRRSHFMHDQGD
ncbi:partitioning defective 6 homolog gamma isoform X2 [Orussus abietinus]|uniref:partitioning defective 6 homolog gamma isoform X2 n=1 Tax=Orussus abietinus TaxID=222816 RepID=UPI000626E937|nr:partitioning defective 6 homolog gamma isoform X2 [Orussus abietinus]